VGEHGEGGALHGHGGEGLLRSLRAQFLTHVAEEEAVQCEQYVHHWGRRVLTNAHSMEHHTQVKMKKRGLDTKYLAIVLAIETKCDIGNGFGIVSSG
jgi:hypothetical protein